MGRGGGGEEGGGLEGCGGVTFSGCGGVGRWMDLSRCGEWVRGGRGGAPAAAAAAADVAAVPGALIGAGAADGKDRAAGAAVALGGIGGVGSALPSPALLVWRRSALTALGAGEWTAGIEDSEGTGEVIGSVGALSDAAESARCWSFFFFHCSSRGRPTAELDRAVVLERLEVALTVPEVADNEPVLPPPAAAAAAAAAVAAAVSAACSSRS